MGIEYRLGRNDHKVVEDFLARGAAGVSAIVLDTKDAGHQRAAAAAAVEQGLEVYLDPATERLVDPGFDLPGMAYDPDGVYAIDDLATSPARRTALIGGVLQEHPTEATTATPPHFFVRDERTANLNVSLAEETVHLHDGPVRATVVLSSQYPLAAATELAAEYHRAGLRDIELRISPLGGDDEGVRKIQRAYALLQAFTSSELTVTLGLSGNVGQVALALGHAAHYSVGIGMRERVNHAGTISRQKLPPKPPADDEDGGGGPSAGMYLPGLAATLPRKLGSVHLANTDIRTRIGCRIAFCGSSVNGPANDVRGHYLHARAAEVERLLASPAQWRARMEVDRLTRARDLRRLINDKYPVKGASPFKLRTLDSLLHGIATEQDRKSA